MNLAPLRILLQHLYSFFWTWTSMTQCNYNLNEIKIYGNLQLHWTHFDFWHGNLPTLQIVECKKNYCQDYKLLNVIDEVKCENFFHRFKVKSLEEELVECNAKLKKVSSAKIDDKLGV